MRPIGGTMHAIKPLQGGSPMDGRDEGKKAMGRLPQINCQRNFLWRSLRSCRKSVPECHKKSDASQGKKNNLFFLSKKRRSVAFQPCITLGGVHLVEMGQKTIFSKELDHPGPKKLAVWSVSLNIVHDFTLLVCGRSTSNYAHFTFSDTIWPLSLSPICGNHITTLAETVSYALRHLSKIYIILL